MHKLQIKRYFLSTLMQTNIGISLYEWQLKIWMDCLDSYEDKPKNQYKLRNKIKNQTIVREREDKYLYENYIVSEKMLKKCEGHLCNWLARVKRRAHFNELMEDHVKGIGSCCKWHFGKRRKIKNKKSKTKNKVLKSILPVVSNQRLAMDNSTSYLKKRIKKIR